MKERGMLFSKPMVLALLDGSKTQTRRLVKPQPTIDAQGNFCWNGWNFGQTFEGPRIQSIASPLPGSITKKVHCPYGKPGERLWVRETFAEVGNVDPGYLIYRASDYMEQVRKYRFDTFLPESKVRWTPSIHMPRRASRIDLEITSVRVERLQDISEEDALAEGIQPISESDGPNYFTANIDGWNLNFSTALGAYQMLWEWINGAGSWDKNPWLWVVEFTRITK
jgi:hypothetical protein